MNPEKKISANKEFQVNDFLKIEYEQTVQTLRNWDTLFFNSFSSLLVAGGIGAFISFIGKDKINIELIKYFLILLVLSLWLIFLLYFLYNIIVASKKFEILRMIEIDTNMKGSYKANVGKTKKFLIFFILPFITLICTLIIYLIWHYVQ